MAVVAAAKGEAHFTQSIPTRGRKRFLSRMGVSVDDEAGAEATAPNPTPPPRLLGPAGWSVTEVGRWLGEIGYKQYAPAFRTHQISGEVLPLLSKDVLGSELGVQSLGHRLLILQAIRQLFPDLPTAPGGMRGAVKGRLVLPTASPGGLPSAQTPCARMTVHANCTHLPTSMFLCESLNIAAPLSRFLLW